ncbi:MAG: hypothetical protein ACRD1V_07930 [Vicinamibacterales bacterium]
MLLRVAVLSIALVVPLSAQTPVPQTAPPPVPHKPSAQGVKPAADLPDARGLIDKYIKAIGGRDAILSHKSEHAQGTFSIAGSGMSGTIEMYGAADPNRVLLKVSVPGIGDIQNGFDGSHGWSINPATGPMLQVGRELDQAKYDSDFYSELRDPKVFPVVKTIEKADFEGRPCYKVSLERVDGVNDFDFYDASTGLRAGYLNKRETPMGEVESTSVESDYKKFGNLLQPTTLVQRAAGVEQKITLESLDYDKVDASVFALPPEIQALIK